MITQIVNFPPKIHVAVLNQREPGIRGRFRLDGLFSINQYGEEILAQWGDEPERHHLSPLDVVLMGPGTRRTFEFPKGGSHAVVHFHSPVIPTNPTPMIFRVGNSGPALQRQIDQILSLGVSPRGDSLLWNFLWDLLELPTYSPNPKHDLHEEALNRALSILHRDFGRELRIREVVSASGVSHNRLTDLFKARFGETIVAHLRRLRMTSAEKMLRHSDQSIKSIAIDVGIPNLQRFNKVFRQHFGLGPREFRETKTQEA